MQGKPEEDLGDLLDGFDPDPSPAAVDAYQQAPLTAAPALLGLATTRLVYDLFAYQRTSGADQPGPPLVAVLTRESHHSELAAGAVPRIQHTLSYSDGFGRQIQQKLRAEPGTLPRRPGRRPLGRQRLGPCSTTRASRPASTSRSSAARTDSSSARTAGFSRILCDDPPGRLIATLHPDHTYDKAVFDAWRHESWDGNDTVLQADPAADPDVGGQIGRLSTRRTPAHLVRTPQRRRPRRRRAAGSGKGRHQARRSSPT